MPIVLSKPSRVTLTFRRADGTIAGQKVFSDLPTGRSVLAWEPQPGLPAGDYTVDARVGRPRDQPRGHGGRPHGQVARDVTPPQIVSLGAYKKRLQWRVIDTETPYITLVVKLRSGRTVRSSGCR